MASGNVHFATRILFVIINFIRNFLIKYYYTREMVRNGRRERDKKRDKFKRQIKSQGIVEMDEGCESSIEIKCWQKAKYLGRWHGFR